MIPSDDDDGPFDDLPPRPHLRIVLAFLLAFVLGPALVALILLYFTGPTR